MINMQVIILKLKLQRFACIDSIKMLSFKQIKSLQCYIPDLTGPQESGIKTFAEQLLD